MMRYRTKMVRFKTEVMRFRTWMTLLRANQIARIASDFKVDVIKKVIRHQTIQTHSDELNWARSRNFHEINSLSLVCLMKSSTFGQGLNPFRLQNSPYFAYSSTREQSNKRSGTRLKVRLAHLARVRHLRHALPIPLLILRKKPTVLQSITL